MPDYGLRAPGVYIEEIAAVGPIQGVGTSTVAFIGEVVGLTAAGPSQPTTSTAPPNLTTTPAPTTPPPATTAAPAPTAKPSPTAPTLVTNWTQYKDLFGEYGTAVSGTTKMMPYAVRGFFDNGGTRAYIVNQSNLETALEALTRYPVNLIVAPDVTSADDQLKILNHCRQQLNRFAILHTAQDPVGQAASAGGTAPTGTTTATTAGPTTTPQPASPTASLREEQKRGYGAIYGPWIEVSAPPAVVANNGPRTVVVPPSGHVAGIYARSDADRGVHKAPANEIIRGALQVATLLNDTEHGALNNEGVNVLRVFPNSAPMVWGARSLTKNPAYYYVNVERLLIYIEESLRGGLRWAVFEPNDFALWKKLERTITEFLTRIWRAGALFGQSPEQAFSIKVDAEVNTADTRASGQVIVEVGVAPVRPAEFVVIRLALREGDA